MNRPLARRLTFGALCLTSLCAVAETKDDAAKKGDADFFAGWATGLAVIKPKQATITDASIVNDKVRVSNKSGHEASILVSKHFYPFSDGTRCLQASDPAASKKGAGDSGTTPADKSKDNTPITDALAAAARGTGRCVGGMVGVGLGTSGGSGGTQLINFVGVGLTIGGGVGKPAQSTWHFGFGIGRKFNGRYLGEGFTEDLAPPAGETQVRFQSRDVSAKFLYFTTNW